MHMDLEEQYDKIYRFCYFKIRHRELAEDITQETFLRFFESREYKEKGKNLHYLYTIARNLCIDEYRKKKVEPLEGEILDMEAEEKMITGISVKLALSALTENERELLLLRYVNEVGISEIGKIYGISRFAVYRRLARAENNLKNKLERGKLYE